MLLNLWPPVIPHFWLPWVSYLFWASEGSGFFCVRCLFISLWTVNVVPFYFWFWSLVLIIHASCMLCMTVAVWFIQIITQHQVHPAPVDHTDVCLRFPGALLTPCHPRRAAGQRCCSASMWQRATVKLFCVSTPPMTFSSQDPKVNTHNPPSSLLSPLISICHVCSC